MKKIKNSQESTRVIFTINKIDKEKIEELAMQNRLSISEYIRKCIYKELYKNEK